MAYPIQQQEYWILTFIISFVNLLPKCLSCPLYSKYIQKSLKYTTHDYDNFMGKDLRIQ